MSERKNCVTNYLLQNILRQLGYVFLWVVVGIILVPIIVMLLSGHASQINVVSTLKNFELGVTLVVILAAIGMRNYDDFRLLIQNGISRKTYWGAKTIALFSATILAQLLGYFYNLFSSSVFHGESWQESSVYINLYGNFFSSNILNKLFAIVFSVMMSCFIVFAANLIGNFFSLFTRKQKYLMLIAVITLLVVTFMLFISWADQNVKQAGALFSLLIGYEKNRDHSGANNPLVPFLNLAIGNVLFLLGNWWITMHLQVRDE